MAILETLEGDTMEPEILCLNGGLKSAAERAREAAVYMRAADMSDVLRQKPKRSVLRSGIPAKMRAFASNKATAGASKPRRRIYAPGAAGARPWGSSSGRFVMAGDEFDPESLEGWLTDLKKGTGKAVRAVGSAGSAVIRPVASVGLNVFRSVAKPLGTVVGTAVGSAFGTTQMGAGTEGMLGNAASMFGMSGGGGAVNPDGTPAAMPTSGGGIPPIYLIGGGALLLVLLLKK